MEYKQHVRFFNPGYLVESQATLPDGSAVVKEGPG